MDVAQEGQKAYYDRSTSGPQYEESDLVMVSNPTKKNWSHKEIQIFL